MMVAKMERRPAAPTVEYANVTAVSHADSISDNDAPSSVGCSVNTGPGASLADVLSGGRIIVRAGPLIGIVYSMIQEHPVTAAGNELSAIGSSIADRMYAILLAILLVGVLLVPLPRR